MRSSDNEGETTNNFSQINSIGEESSGFRFDPEFEDDETFQYSFNFDKQFNGESDHTLTFAFQYERSKEVEESLIVQNGFDSENVRTAEDQRRVFLQSDYVVPLGKAVSLKWDIVGILIC